ncbi:MAG TPA: cyclopropane-fatty-acyl-phospholipid synthase family protein [Sphingobium sp.]|uniref:cyclopropane-fatty-acyl-phospholipid synthase family protein n=1 Tax=Sphingobium sp. TaxID=1912891 RepID=UPI002ED673FB
MFLLEKVLTRLVKKGILTVIDHKGKVRRFGVADPDFTDVTIRLADGRVPFDLVRSPGLGAAETFMDGRMVIEKGDILAFIALVQKNNRWEDDRHMERPSGFKHALGMALRPLAQVNLPGRSRRNVAYHYDLDGGLYDLFLDADRQYSCAYYGQPDTTLEDAQEAKKKHIAAKLALSPGQKVLDIGCGWGGMALYLNKHYDVDVTGITLSTEQLGVARKRAEEAGVSDRVRFELIDYRKIGGRFDRIVSVGMFEHVGVPHFREFFRTCHNLLKPDGVMLLHTIGRVDGPSVTDAFTRKYIFPGGYIPALSETMAAVETNRLMISDVEILRLHYAKTLRHWYERTVANQEKIEALYDARFFRMWTFYLAGAICAFEFGAMVNFQLQFVRDRHSLPITRDYMIEEG